MMQKKIIVAVTVALGLSTTAYAANPFSDLPAGHWAYASVAKLAAAGVVDGYPDGTFKGNRTMTRYEMAQIVAKALAKGAIGADDKLVGEFADELDNLGVRVAKLEKNADNVKITANIRAHYDDTKLTDAKNNDSKAHEARIRSRIFFTGEVNDNWHYVSMLQNEQVFAKNGLGDNEAGDDGTSFQRAYLTGNLGKVNITAGRYHEDICEGNVYSLRADGIKAKVKLGGNVSLTGVYGKMASAEVNSFIATAGTSRADKYYRFALNGNWGNVSAEANYLQADKVTSMGMNGTDDKIWTIGANYKAKNFNVGAIYLKGNNDTVDAAGYSQNGIVATLGYKGAKSSVPNSWGVYGKYYNQGASTLISHTMNGYYNSFPLEGFKGYLLAANYTLAKNMVAEFQYYDLKGKETDKKAKTLWTQMTITF